MSSFDRFAADYERCVDRSTRISGEGSSYFAAYKARYVANLLPRDFEGKILDFGCGTGYMAECLRQALPNAELHGYDESAAMAAEASRRVPGGTFTTNSGALGLDYDLVVAANVLHHVELHRRSDLVEGLRRRLRPAGRLLIFEHNPLNLLTRWAVSRCPFDKGVRLLAPSETTDYMRRAGLERVRVEYIVFFPRAMRWCRRFESSLWWCPVGAQYVALATRER